MAGMASSVDVHVGRRIRLLRGLRKYSQEKLAKALGITFQQVQKYERGTNRIGAGRLYEMARILGVPVGFFFDELDSFTIPLEVGLQEEQASFQKGGASKANNVSLKAKEGGEIELLMMPETLELAKAYYSIKDERNRQKLLSFIREIARGP